MSCGDISVQTSSFFGTLTGTNNFVDVPYTLIAILRDAHSNPYTRRALSSPSSQPAIASIEALLNATQPFDSFSCTTLANQIQCASPLFPLFTLA